MAIQSCQNYQQITNSLWPCDAIWQHRSGSALAHFAPCCQFWLNKKIFSSVDNVCIDSDNCLVQATSHHLNQWWRVRWCMYAVPGLDVFILEDRRVICFHYEAIMTFYFQRPPCQIHPQFFVSELYKRMTENLWFWFRNLGKENAKLLTFLSCIEVWQGWCHDLKVIKLICAECFD